MHFLEFWVGEYGPELVILTQSQTKLYLIVQVLFHTSPLAW